MQLCHVTNEPFDLFLGNHESCDHSSLPEECNCLHIVHESPGMYCKTFKRCLRDNDYLMDYREHDLLTIEQIDLVVQLANSGKPLFVHCAAGIGRSPTICVLALAARKVAPWNAMSRVAEAMWREYNIKHCPSFDCKVLNQIFAFYDRLE